MKRRKHECGSCVEYSDRHDALYCPKCDEWLEKQCNDSECQFCVGRSAKPLSRSDGEK